MGEDAAGGDDSDGEAEGVIEEELCSSQGTSPRF